MLNLNDLNYIYNLIERANITGGEVDKVVALKLKIIDILQEAAANSAKAFNNQGATPSAQPQQPETATAPTSTEPVEAQIGTSEPIQ